VIDRGFRLVMARPDRPAHIKAYRALDEAASGIGQLGLEWERSAEILGVVALGGKRV
jgi:hypothetical protein